MYSPVVNWISVRTLLSVASIRGLPTKCINFVLAFMQAELDINVFMELPVGIDVPKGNPKEYILHLNCFIYDFKFTEEGTADNYLAIDIICLEDPKCNSFELRQPYFIKIILELIGLTPDVKGYGNPAHAPLLFKNLDDAKRKQSWHYRSTVGMPS
eukprot:14368558-Ditylum_brightwellii.AAC.1